MAWTNTSKPTGTPYTNVAKPTGASYTNVSKPTGGGGTMQAGMANGLLIPLTKVVTVTAPGASWVNVNKPNA